MQITQAGVTVQPLTFHFGVLMLSGGGNGTGTGGGPGGGVTGGGPGGGVTGGGPGGGVTGGGSTGSSDTGGAGYAGALGLLALLLGGLGVVAATPPQEQAPVVAAGPAIIAPAASAPAAVAPVAVAATPAAPAGSQPVVLVASAAQPAGAGPAASAPKNAPGVVLPYTGANLWLPIAAGSGLIGLGVWLRVYAQRFREE